MNYTTPEQAQKLIEAGLPIETADMHYINDKHPGYVPYQEMKMTNNEWLKGTKITPCWSLGTLVDLMPYEIKEDGDTYRLLITHKLAQYPRLTTLWPSLYNSHADSTFEAVYNMMVWLLENKYL